MAPISKDPDDYVRDKSLVTLASPGEPGRSEPVEPSPPWWNRYPWMVAATVVVLVATGLIDHAYDVEHYVLLAIPAGWTGTSLADRRWRLRHTSRTTPSWPATTFAVLGIVVGLVLLATLSGHERQVGLYVSVAVGWWGGDLLDWLLVRHDRRRKGSPAGAHA